MNWLDICSLDEINPLGSRTIKGPKGEIAIFRTGDDEVFALDDRCPHKGGPLSQGLIYGKRVARALRLASSSSTAFLMCSMPTRCM